MKTVTQLENELAEAREEIRWLKEAMTPPKDFRIPGQHRVGLTRHHHTILHALAIAKGPLSHDQLTTWLEIVSGHELAPKSVDVAIHRLRKLLETHAPNIVVRNKWGIGYYLDDESKALVLGAERKAA